MSKAATVSLVREIKEMLKTGSYVCACETPERSGSVVDNLITGYIASGVKLPAKDNSRRLYGTREVIIVSAKGGSYKIV